MPGGVAGVQPRMAAPYADWKINMRRTMRTDCEINSQTTVMVATGMGVGFFEALPAARTSSTSPTAPSWHLRVLSAQVWALNALTYVNLNVLDDPAWLALMFC
jgi:hypothetical protein